MDQNRMNFEGLLNETRKVNTNSEEKEDKKVNESDALGKGPGKCPEMKGKDPDLSNVNESDLTDAQLRRKLSQLNKAYGQAKTHEEEDKIDAEKMEIEEELEKRISSSKGKYTLQVDTGSSHPEIIKKSNSLEDLKKLGDKMQGESPWDDPGTGVFTIIGGGITLISSEDKWVKEQTNESSVNEEEDLSGVDDSEPMAAVGEEDTVTDEGNGKEKIEELISYNLLEALKKLSLEIKQELDESGVSSDEIVNYLSTILKDEKTEPAKEETPEEGVVEAPEEEVVEED